MHKFYFQILALVWPLVTKTQKRYLQEDGAGVPSSSKVFERLG